MKIPCFENCNSWQFFWHIINYWSKIPTIKIVNESNISTLVIISINENNKQEIIESKNISVKFLYKILLEYQYS
jgi:hypothetical protein